MSILRHESDGTEFFTVQATGESGMSQSGLARLCGVGSDAINKLLKSVMTSSCPDFLKPLQDMELTLVKSVHEFKNAAILKDSVCARILEWYAFESQRPTEKARQAFRQFAAIGIRTWIQSITGWDSLPKTKVLNFQPSIPEATELMALDDVDIATLLKQLKSLRQDLDLALKHRHIIHNVVEKPVAVDLSLNRIVHTAIHEQAIKLNRAIATIEAIERGVAIFSGSMAQVKQKIELCSTLHQMTNLIEQLRQENNNQKQVIDRQQVLISSSRKSVQQIPHRETRDLRQALQPRIKEITAILMKSQKRTGGNRAIDTCTTKATIFARYEIGQSLSEIAECLQMSYETVKTYVKLTRAELKSYYS